MSFIIQKVVVGVHFNSKMFKIQSMAGSLADSIFEFVKEKKKIFGDDFVTGIAVSTDVLSPGIEIKNESRSHYIRVTSENLTFGICSVNELSSVNVDDSLEKFKILYKHVDKILKLPNARRIGLVTENLLDVPQGKANTNFLVEKILRIQPPQYSGLFELRYEDRELPSSNAIPDADRDDFWNTIYSLYPSERDADMPVRGKVFANIDVQKYYNPSKSDPCKELGEIRSKFKVKKSEFKNQLKELGLLNND